MPPGNNADTPLALTNDSLRVGAQSSDVSVKRNGSSVSYASNYTTPGVYSISEKASAVSGVASVQGMDATSSSNATPGSAVTAVIDRSGPTLAVTSKRNGASYVVSVKASDVSGVKQLKYKAGACSLTDFKTGGTAFTGSFTATPGKYTVYAKDAFGYESLSVHTVTSPDPSAYLNSVGISAGKLSRSFSKSVYSYNIALGENQPSVTLTPVKEWDGATVTINGKAVSSSTIAVANGKTVKATVKVTYGKTSKTYTFSIARAKSTNNNLSGLTSTAGKFNAGFSAGVTNYTLTLDENTPSATIKAAVQNSLAKSSPSSKKVTLKNGQSKTVKFTVKAQSGAKKTYAVTVTRAKSSNTALKSLKTDSSKYPLSPAFSTGTTGYTVTLPAEKSKVTISAKAANSLTGVTVDGKKGSKKFTLANGQSITVKVVVTAQSGVKKEYTVTINRL
jgi:VCBS repeat-containing protein